MRWYVDNVQRGVATASGTDWTFTWDPSGVTDGTSLIRAQAYDRYGQTGSGYVVTVLLNRFAPAAPTGVVGGRNLALGHQRRRARVEPETPSVTSPATRCGA